MPQGPKRALSSSIQKEAVVNVLSRSILTADQRASLCDHLQEGFFEDNHTYEILKHLEAVGSDLTGQGRRKQQDGRECLNYITDGEWQSIGELEDPFDVIDSLISLAIMRCNLVNPSEPTKKMFASASIVATQKDLTAIPNARKLAVHKHAVSKWMEMTRRLEEPKGVEYCRKFPNSYKELKDTHPRLYQNVVDSVKEGDNIVRFPFAKQGLMVLDQSYKCRGNSSRPSTELQTFDAQPGGGMNMQQVMQCFMQMAGAMQERRGQEDGDEIPLQYNGKRKRLRELQDVMNDQGRSSSHRLALGRQRSRDLLGESDGEDGREDGPRGRDAFLTPPPKKHDTSPVLDVGVGAPALAKEGKDLALADEAKAPGEVKAPGLAEEVAEEVQQPAKAASILDALIARDGERAEQAKAKAAIQRAEKAAAKKAEKEAEIAANRGAGKAALPLKTIQKKCDGKANKSNASELQKPKKLEKTPVTVSPNGIFKAKPAMSHEGTRSQYLCRTGLKGPGQSHAIKYGEGHGMTKEEAQASAKEWVSSHAVH